MGNGPQDIAAKRAKAQRDAFIAKLKPGRFEGEVNATWLGREKRSHALWRFNPLPGARRFRYVADDGYVIEPEEFITDFGTVPRAAWSLYDMHPYAYAAYICHDWMFEQHHRSGNRKDVPVSFERCNWLLAEGIYTQMVVGYGPELVKARKLFANLQAIYQAVQSPIGRKYWNA